MKKLDISPIAPGIALYLKGGTLQFLQLAYQEALSELVTSRIGSVYDSTKGYILNGCINTGSGSSYVISAGSVFFNGEVFLVDAATFTLSGSNVAEGIITTTQYVTDADPAGFTDGVSRNIHNIRKIVFQNGLSGSGAFDFNNGINLSYKPLGGIGQTIEWSIPSGSITDYFNVSTGVGIHSLTLGWIIDDAGFFVVGYKNGDADFGSITTSSGSRSFTLIPANIPPLSTSNDFAASTGSTFTSYVKTPNSAASLGSVPVNAGVTPSPINTLPPFSVKLKIKRVS